MWKERPVFGWGPGTYMFQYAPFQAAEDRTIISTNFGVQGNAHSEYFGPLSEQGVLGMLLMLALGLLLRNSITQPLSVALNIANKIAAGDFDVQAATRGWC